jgi:hypothetical protein
VGNKNVGLQTEWRVEFDWWYASRNTASGNRWISIQQEIWIKNELDVEYQCKYEKLKVENVPHGESVSELSELSVSARTSGTPFVKPFGLGR